MTSLLSQSLCSIKNKNDKIYAYNMTIAKSISLQDLSHIILNEKTNKHKVDLLISDRNGSNIELVLQKQSGKIFLMFHKKKSFECTLMIVDTNDVIIDRKQYKKDTLKQLLVEYLLTEYIFEIFYYIQQGMSKNIKVLKNLVSKLIICNYSLNIDISNTNTQLMKIML